MTSSQRPSRAASGVPARRTLGRALRDLYDEQAYAWERFILSCRAPQPCTHAPVAAGSGRRQADPGSPAEASAGSGGQAARDGTAGT